MSSSETAPVSMATLTIAGDKPAGIPMTGRSRVEIVGKRCALMRIKLDDRTDMVNLSVHVNPPSQRWAISDRLNCDTRRALNLVEGDKISLRDSVFRAGDRSMLIIDKHNGQRLEKRFTIGSLVLYRA